ncbi:MAG: hypothetical protein ACRD0H_10550, partial [Actinomycetes bacterium]
AAPHQHQHQQVLIDEVRALVDAAALEHQFTSLGRLIAALWIAADPVINSDRADLHRQIAADCIDLARRSPKGPSPILLQAAGRHQREAEWWG